LIRIRTLRIPPNGEDRVAAPVGTHRRLDLDLLRPPTARSFAARDDDREKLVPTELDQQFAPGVRHRREEELTASVQRAKVEATADDQVPDAVAPRNKNPDRVGTLGLGNAGRQKRQTREE
jgi:hypothetical protein